MVFRGHSNRSGKLTEIKMYCFFQFSFSSVDFQSEILTGLFGFIGHETQVLTSAVGSTDTYLRVCINVDPIT